MKKLFSISILFLLISLSGRSQSWSVVGTGNDLTGPAANIWTLKSDTVSNLLYVGGCFDSINGFQGHHIGKWNTVSFSNMGSGVDSGGSYGVIASEIYNGNFYAAGEFFHANGILASHIAKWDGTNWDSLASGLNGWVNVLKVFNGKLYAGGSFNLAGGIAVDSIAVWDGNVWAAVGTSSINGAVFGMEVYNSELYVLTSIACYKLNNNNWINLAVQTSLPYAAVYNRGMAVYNGELYVGGLITAGGNPVNSIARWNGNSWSSVGSGLSENLCGYCASMPALTVYHNALYAGGFFNRSGNTALNNIAKWDGISWSDVGLGVDGGIIGMEVFNNALYVGGGFSNAGNVHSRLIAKWTENTGIQDYLLDAKSISVYPNPSHGNISVSIDGDWNSSSFKIIVTDIVGNILTESNSPIHSRLLDLSSLPKGFYFVKVADEKNRSSVKKIILY